MYSKERGLYTCLKNCNAALLYIFLNQLIRLFPCIEWILKGNCRGGIVIEKVLETYLKTLCEGWVDRESNVLSEYDRRIMLVKKDLIKERQAGILKVKATATTKNTKNKSFDDQIDFRLHMQFLIKQKDSFYVEESVEDRTLYLIGGSPVSEMVREDSSGYKNNELPLTVHPVSAAAYRQYNRLDAVKYADRYWYYPNKNFKTFKVDCTNYISQCLLAGGIPMTSTASRGKGWWYTGNSWSYSWAVANAFRWYLSEDRNTMGAVHVDQPDLLNPGDIICYDFEGDGKWDHSTIVTAKDAYGMPLVNAHTVPSKYRYWSYQDSYAYTDKTTYRFFRIGNRQ